MRKLIASMLRMAPRFVFPLFASALLSGAALAQDEDLSTNIVGSETDWSVFVEADPAQCWVVSTPSDWEASRDGEDVTDNVNRGEIMMFVTYWPNDERLGEVSFTGGYPFADGSTVSVEIGSDTFELFTEGEMAWAQSPEDDNRIITAMRGGSEALLTAQSSRGTQTADTFSLLGFTAAIEDAEARCGS